MKHLGTMLLLLLTFASSGAAQEDERALCGPIVIEHDYDLKWTTSEKRVLCGGKGVDSWQNIPLNQAEFLLRNFLQSRGYHKPRFEKIGELLHVQPGIPTLITSIRTIPDIPAIESEKYWAPIGKPLTPTELNNIEKWLVFKLGRLGYACPQISSAADRNTGEVLLRVQTGDRWNVREIISEPIPYVRGGVLERYWAFDIGDTYDPILLALSANRMQASQAVVNTSFSPECKGQIGGIRQTTLPGQPRLVTFGFGFDSENLFIVRGSWRNSRLTETASLLDLSGMLSYREQTLLASFNWYYLPFPTRHYLKNYLRAERKFESNFETRTIKGLMAPAWQQDLWGLNLDAYIGPSLQFESTIRGEAPNATRLLTADIGINGQSHLYEYYLSNPQTGYQFNLFGSFSNQSAVSDLTLAHYRLSFTSLWNLLNFDPEIWILGLRGLFATTRPGPGVSADNVPASFKQFLGGSDDMRGFSRKSLPRNQTGSLTKAYLGTELRLNNILPHNLQPLIFIDGGWLGEEAFDFDPRIFWSPGLGLRWQSPIGTVRGSTAYGFVDGKDEEQYDTKLQFYFSLGEQF